MGFAQAIKAYGKELDVQVAIGGVTYTAENCISANPHYEGALFSTVMKCLDLEINGQISLSTDTVTRFAFGVKAPGDASYFYKDYGSYIIKAAKYDVGADTTKIECYDKMLQAMIPYDIKPDYADGVTIKELLNAICARLGWTLASETFTNAAVAIPTEPYNSEYTFRDVLNEIAQITGSVIAFKPDGLLYVLYPSETSIVLEEDNLKRLELSGYHGPLNSLVLARTPQEDNIYKQDEDSVRDNGLCEVKIENNQIVEVLRVANESGDGNEDYFTALFDSVKGLKYALYSVESFGIGTLDLCDTFKFQTQDGTQYSCLFLSDDLKITQGLAESSKAERPEETAMDYKVATKTDRLLAQTILRVNKQANEIKSLVSDVEGNKTTIRQTAENFEISVKSAVKDDIDSVKGEIDDIKKDLDANFEISKDGLTIKTGGEASNFSSTFAGKEWAIKEGGNKVTWVTNETLHSKNAEIENTLTLGGIVKIVPVNYAANKGIGFVGII